MTADLDTPQLRAALQRWCDALEASAAELNALDGRLGDGDLGGTLQKCAANVRPVAAAGDGDLAATLKACAQACARASGSSFGTLLAVGFLAAAKNVGAAASLDRRGLVGALQAVQEAIAARGGAKPGDKTMLDSLRAIVDALHRCAEGAGAAELKAASRAAARDALDSFRGQPNRIGRARMFADASIGLDDPGMVAVRRMVDAL